MKRGKKIGLLFVMTLMLFSIVLPLNAEEHAASQRTEEARNMVEDFTFDDMEEAEWASEYMINMKANEILSGYPDGSFRPNQPVKRVEAIVTAVRLMGLEEEAKERASASTSLFFKDAKLIDQKYAWAKGYMLVALEQGLFHESEEKMEPGKPASRLWAASLLVKALGLQSEALSQMTTSPEFTDVNAVPAGALGYINVAVEYEIVSGYPDGTFKPHKNVTRAEMAVLLSRAREGFLEQSGANTIQGEIMKVEWVQSSTVTEEVYHSSPEGMHLALTVQIDQGPLSTYTVPSDLLVQFRGRYMNADQLLAGDRVVLVVEGESIIEAVVLNESDAGGEHQVDSPLSNGILSFKLELEYGAGQEIELAYKDKKGKLSAKIEMGENREQKDDEALQQMLDYLAEMQLSADMNRDDLLEAVLRSLDIELEEISELELTVQFTNGKKLNIELEAEEDEEDEDEHDEEDEEEEEHRSMKRSKKI
ncbi:S-layer homology domain-containing protein [Marinicrinis sediminis]|uniref:S-layer homology domain-containing protein n=1 Tax=Marinicrinis sediminis TaxID=1652465 RepID=A0ABW5RH78_9BACL